MMVRLEAPDPSPVLSMRKDFNSMMVRLEANFQQPMRFILSKFQFHDGAIGSGNVSKVIL